MTQKIESAKIVRTGRLTKKKADAVNMKLVAQLTIHDPATMTPEERAEVVEWLVESKKYFSKHYKDFNKKCVIRFWR